MASVVVSITFYFTSFFFFHFSHFFKRSCERMATKLPANFPVVNGNFEDLFPKVQDYVADKVKLCTPDNLHICDGSPEENQALIKQLMDDGIATPLFKHDNW